ncbi:MAG: hypothetical protein HFJ94_04780 [Muribaculaceae bacterium]|nr:hypothetical protein [Muribaculaceae bacterium]
MFFVISLLLLKGLEADSIAIYLTATMLISAYSANSTSRDVKVVEPNEFKATLVGGGDIYLLDIRRPEEL